MASLIGAAIAFSLAGWGTSELSSVLHGNRAKEAADREYRRQIDAYNRSLTEKHERNMDRDRQIRDADAQIILNRRVVAEESKREVSIPPPPSYEKIYLKEKSNSESNKAFTELAIFTGVVVATVVGYKLYKDT